MTWTRAELVALDHAHLIHPLTSYPTHRAHAPRAVFFAPPLVVTPAQVDAIVDAARAAALAVFGS